jgi:mannose-1-phosphate guanylyltransferase
MAGGLGTRFWYLSRQKFQKYFHENIGNRPHSHSTNCRQICGYFPQQKHIRCNLNGGFRNPLGSSPFLTATQIHLKPIQRNTAPCMAYSSSKIVRKMQMYR